MKLIKSSGQPGEIMIVGDYPTKNEYAQNWAFSGAAERILEQFLHPHKINASQIFKTYYFKVPCPGAEASDKRIRENAIQSVHKIENWDKIISEQIEAVDPNLIITFGEIPLRYLTGQKDIDKRRGSIYPLLSHLTSRPRNVLVTLSIRDLYEQKFKPFVYMAWDIEKGLQIKNLRSVFKPRELIWIPKSPSELENWWERAKNANFITCDIETHHGFITCIGFSHDGYEAISIPLITSNKPDTFTVGLYYKFIKKVLSSGIPVVNQNIKYDWRILEQWGFPIKNIVGDTMLMAHTLYPELDKNLGFLASIYSDQPYYKDEGRDYDPRIHDPERLLIYNAKDALVTHQVWTKQQQDAQNLGVKKFFFDNVMPTFFIYKDIEDRGIRVDLNKRRELHDKYSAMLADIRAFINTVAEENINPASPKQSARFIYDILKCPCKVPRTVQNRPSDNLTILDIYVHATEAQKILLKKFIVARKILKVLQFLEIPLSENGYLKTSYKLHGTETGRTSGGKSLDYAYIIEGNSIKEVNIGITLQNIMKRGEEFEGEIVGEDVRKIFVPNPGYVFIEGDQSQAEARVVCVLADDKVTLNLFETTDIHKVTASWIYGIPADQVTDRQRYYGKKARHAGNYNMGSFEFARQTQLPVEQCKKILEKFHASAPKVRCVFHAKVRKEINEKRYLISPSGRRRDFFGQISEDMYKEAYSTIPQSTVSDHNKFTILRKMVEIYKPPLAYPIAESHDSLTFEVRREIYREFIDTFKEVIETPISFEKCSIQSDIKLIIPGEIQLGEISWGDMVKWKK